MIIEVEFDPFVLAGFRIFARWPLGLAKQIGAEKEGLFAAAARDPLVPSVRTGERIFQVQGKAFTVLYAVGTPYVAETGEVVERLRITRIEP